MPIELGLNTEPAKSPQPPPNLEKTLGDTRNTFRIDTARIHPQQLARLLLTPLTSSSLFLFLQKGCLALRILDPDNPVREVSQE